MTENIYQDSPSSASHAPSKSWRFDALLLGLFPFIQIGFSFWVSAASLSAILTITRLRSQIAAGFRQHPWALFVFPVMFLPLVFEYSTDLTQDILRTGRESLAAILMYWMILGSSIIPGRIDIRRTTQAITVLSGCLLALTVFQFILLRKGIYFGFPEEIFALRSGTLPTELDLIYSNIRPAATFSEPSYLAFVLLSLLLVFAARFERDHGGRPTLATILITGLLSQALSFVMFGAGVIGVLGMRTMRGANKLFVIPIILGISPLILGSVISIFGGDFVVIDRIQRLTQGTEDFSVFVRIFGPLGALPSYLGQFPIGLPLSSVLPSISGYAVVLGINPSEYLMNGLFNLFFQYGYLGFIISLLFLYRKDFLVSLYILSCMLFNGSFLQTDKLSIIGISIFLYYSIRHSSSEESKS